MKQREKKIEQSKREKVGKKEKKEVLERNRKKSPAFQAQAPKERDIPIRKSKKNR